MTGKMTSPKKREIETSNHNTFNLNFINIVFLMSKLVRSNRHIILFVFSV